MMSSVVPGPGGMTWTIGECGCGRTTWSVRGGKGLGVLMVAECGCGERRELRLSTGPGAVSGPLEIQCTYDEVVPSPEIASLLFGPSTIDREFSLTRHTTGPAAEVVASLPEGMERGPSVIDRAWQRAIDHAAALDEAFAVGRDIAALDPRCPTKTVAEVAAERGYASDASVYIRTGARSGKSQQLADAVRAHAEAGGLKVNAPPAGWVAPVMGCGRLVEVMVDWGPPLRGRVTVMDDGACDFEVEHFDERTIPLGSQVEVRRGWDGVQRVFLQEREAHPQSAVGLLLAMPGVIEAEVRADRHTGAWHITYRGGPSPTVIRQALREAFPKQPFTVGRQGDAHPGTAASFMDAAMSVPGVLSCVILQPAPGCVTVLYRGDVSPAAVRSAVEEEKPFGCSLIVERDREEYALPLPPAPFGQFSVPSPEDFSDPTDYFRKQKALRLSKLAEAQAAAKTRTTAKLLHAAERHSNPSVRDIARVELLARAAEAARPPDIRDEWDNLEDVEPEGIVPRGAK